MTNIAWSIDFEMPFSYLIQASFEYPQNKHMLKLMDKKIFIAVLKWMAIEDSNYT